jgi:prepilin-type N-terminal cleavage/methylation domain-containing protein
MLGKSIIMNKRAFTLIELLVVVLIIGILAAIALPKYQYAVTKAKVTKIMIYMRSVKDASDLYYLQNSTYAGFDSNTVMIPTTGPCGTHANVFLACSISVGGQPVSIRQNFSNATWSCVAGGTKFCITEDTEPKNNLAQKLCKDLCGITQLQQGGGGCGVQKNIMACTFH